MSAGLVDLHHHFLPQAHMRAEHQRLGKAHALSSEKLLSWTPERSLRDMDAHGVAYAVGSISTPGVWFGDVGEARDSARRWNAFAADVARTWPERFGFFATVVPPDVDGALREIAHSLDVLGARGVALFSNYDGVYLGDDAFTPVLAELNRRRAIVFVHPTVAPACVGILPGLLPQVIEFAFDTTRTIVSLLTSGCLRRFPDIRWVFTHAGGAIPMLAARLEHTLAQREPFRAQMPDGAGSELRKLRYDIGGATGPGALAALKSMAGSDKVVFGTDAPFVPIEKGLRELAGSDIETDAATVFSRNGARLLGF